ncbi:NADH:ubiquinone reductase (Na(+)-transporting) subunit E [Prosthecochloris sp. N3]|uniref:Na(+)-translocating NADH-quinone reductase subunit E n=1 Tax=Prosthecochloris ethylica TaxID=2743976 RepID=A0ABR9XU87_9CHLB|nr:MULTISPECIES: NADH:ubiquinone reductase (Na(+)-transporting) subunit E [Prosthecochloris]MEC9486725.1 NADH:ubiquinone reductase (Na(+)-transporting) subunit E [Prosthecochloris sp.]MBF0587243.1 NADH:ubiquinone reductase (Na(+)-transporting) subunit E [Prosthecochloris ethylica]MBF0637316.1 NADH:ubiquinone reductase (Na(+)-transporting) subunit E [Prosthecochloris ethylica]NUK48405.1 NADH:ubiquinone reductase (Na(+)-transporting) subunit E [Prosthecochloris ethylica]RNA65593.1 NADH:ubiquinon
MDGWTHYLSLAVETIFIKNILLAYFLGMCSFLAISRKVETSIGLGLAVIFVNGITVPANWMIREFLLGPGALSWTGIAGLGSVDLSFLNYIVFIATIAAMVQLVEMVLDKVSPTLYQSLGIFLPLIAVNCAILGSSLFMVERDYDFLESAVFGASAGVGFFLAIVTLATMRYKLKYSNVPPGLRGLGIAMLLTGLISMAYMSFSGINL